MFEEFDIVLWDRFNFLDEYDDVKFCLWFCLWFCFWKDFVIKFIVILEY